MPKIKIYTETELRREIMLDLPTVDCVADAFRALAGGKVVMPPILSMALEEHHGEIDVKTAYVPGLESFAIKMSPGFFDNPKIGLPSTSGLMILFSALTGVVEALLLDNGYLTDVRTAAAGAVAARHLARPDAETACIVGAGAQARLQLQALSLVRPIKKAVIWARDHDKAVQVAADMAGLLRIEVGAEADLQTAIQAADMVVTTTPATDPLVKAKWLQPGQHVTAMGSDQHTKCELEPACIARADLYVPDRRAQTELLGELRSAIDAGAVSADTEFPELGDIVAGKAHGRPSSDAITICDLTGTGVQDTAIATFASRKLHEVGAGTEFFS